MASPSVHTRPVTTPTSSRITGPQPVDVSLFTLNTTIIKKLNKYGQLSRLKKNFKGNKSDELKNFCNCYLKNFRMKNSISFSWRKSNITG